MKLEKDYEEFIELLNAHKVRYLIVGAYAVSFYARPRNTGDIDFFVGNTPQNVEKLLETIKEFGFAELELDYNDFKDEDTILQLGYEPVRIDIMTGISGVTFEKAYQNRKKAKLGSQEVSFISFDDLLKNKRASDRTKDKADAELLEEFRDQGA